MVRFNLCSKTNVAKLNALVLCSSTSACYWDPEVVFRQYESYYPLCDLVGKYSAFSGNDGVSIMSWSLPQPPLRSPPKTSKSNTMRLSVWRFGWGRNTAQERYGTILHCTSNRGDDCWIEHGIQVCPTLYVQWIFSIARVLILTLFVFWNVQTGRTTLIYGRKFCCQKNIKRQLSTATAVTTDPSFFRTMGQIQVLPKQASLRRETWIAIVPPHLLFCHTTHTNSCSSISK